MATAAEVHGILQLLARELSPRRGWAVDEGPAWAQAFDRTEPDQLRRAAEKWLARGSDKVPKLAEFRRMVASTGTTTVANACAKCVEGWRGIAWHKQGRDGVEVVNLAARCTCGAGTALNGMVPDWRGTETALQGKPETVAVYVDPTLEQRIGHAIPETDSKVLWAMRDEYGLDLPQGLNVPHYTERDEEARW